MLCKQRLMDYRKSVGTLFGPCCWKAVIAGNSVVHGAKPDRLSVNAKRAWSWFKMRIVKPKKLIEQAYIIGEVLGLSVWCEDEAGPYSTMPYPGGSWQPIAQPMHQPHEYSPNGTAKLLTLFHPASGQVR